MRAQSLRFRPTIILLSVIGQLGELLRAQFEIRNANIRIQICVMHEGNGTQKMAKSLFERATSHFRFHPLPLDFGFQNYKESYGGFLRL